MAILVALILRGRHDTASRLLIGNLFLIGIGSFLFHTFAQQWAGIADVVPILLFILLYIFFATRRFLGQSTLISSIAVIGFLPFAIGSSWLIGLILGPLNGSTIYASVALLIAIYGLILIQKDRKSANGLLIGAAILTISISFRSIDQTICSQFPLGSHFLWHILNGLMLGWMIMVLSQRSKD